ASIAAHSRSTAAARIRDEWWVSVTVTSPLLLAWGTYPITLRTQVVSRYRRLFSRYPTSMINADSSARLQEAEVLTGGLHKDRRHWRTAQPPIAFARNPASFASVCAIRGSIGLRPG